MSLWDESRLGMGGGYRHALGVWDPRHKLASLAWMPPLSERRKLAGLVRYVYAINFALDPSGVGTARFTVTSDFWWTDTIASVEGSGSGVQGYTIRLYDTKNQVRYMNIPLANMATGTSTFAGGAVEDLYITPQLELLGIPAGQAEGWTFPYYQRRIDKIPKGATMVMQVQANQAFDTTGTMQVCLGGYIR